jgi:hypothetical protein
MLLVNDKCITAMIAIETKRVNFAQDEGIPRAGLGNLNRAISGVSA